MKLKHEDSTELYHFINFIPHPTPEGHLYFELTGVCHPKNWDVKTQRETRRWKSTPTKRLTTKIDTLRGKIGSKLSEIHTHWRTFPSKYIPIQRLGELTWVKNIPTGTAHLVTSYMGVPPLPPFQDWYPSDHDNCMLINVVALLLLWEHIQTMMSRFGPKFNLNR